MIRRLPEHEIVPELGKVRRRRRLRTIAMLPTLLTLGNLCFGFCAIYFAVREIETFGGFKQVAAHHIALLDSELRSYLSIAVWMIVLAMVCDALDGRVARKTGQASKFGEQLDSLADVVSFGAAPAMMMLVLERRELWEISRAAGNNGTPGRLGQAAMVVAVIYLCCTALRLARFNVEASLEEAAHRGFKGLPSPAAAAAVASLVLLHDYLDRPEGDYWADVVAWLLPFCTLAVALLMVSRVRYTHAVSAFLRRRPFGHVIPVLLAIPLFFMYTELMIVLFAWGFVFSGPVQMLISRTRPPADAATAATGPQKTGPNSESGHE